LLLSLSALLAACSADSGRGAQQAQAPLVRTVGLQPDAPTAVRVSGLVRARVEAPLTFQRGGRIVARHVDAGEQVSAGTLLFSLDARAAQAQRARAQAALELAAAEAENAAVELARVRDLIRRELASEQALDAAALRARASQAQLQLAQSELQLADIAVQDTELRAPTDGVVMQLLAEEGAVMRPEAAVLLFAEDGPREVELLLPDAQAPAQLTLWHGGEPRPLTLREVDAVADASSRGWRARYQLPAELSLPFGSVVSVSLGAAPRADVFSVPLAALDERGRGPQLWQVVDGAVQPLPVEVLGLDREQARIRADLPADTAVVALGTHLLSPGMAVREQRR
jgi:RND family efflux transporter MFP subunit